MNQTTNGLARTTLIRDRLTQHGKLLTTDSSSQRIIERWHVGKQFFMLEIYPSGYNLYQTPAGGNDVDADLAAIENAA